MSEIADQLRALFSSPLARDVARAVVIVVIGGVVAAVASRRLRALGGRVPSALLVRRVVVWVIWGLALSWALRELGLDVGVLLGAAGVLTVALGFASQTSVSNVISGVFLMGERPFVVGDTITASGVTGEVLSIDLLSIKLRTFDNLLVRIPNETVLKSPVTNLTHFPIRRYDMKLGVAYGTDLGLVRDVLVDLAAEHPLCLVEPEPMVVFTGFGESSIDLQFSVWATKDNQLALRKTLHEGIVAAFARHGVEIPFPQRVVHAAAGAVRAAPGQGDGDGDAQPDGPGGS